MKILALDFSSPQRSVAVWNDSAVVSEIVDASPGRDMKPFALIERALRQAGVSRETIECLAIGLGPGSYTGIRVAVSLAQGWQLATEVKLLGISSVECIAAQAASNGGNGKISVVVDAQRGEFYLASYATQSGGTFQETAPLRLATRADVEERENAGELLAGPEVTRWFPNGKIVFPQATTLARLASARIDFLPGEKLDPIYLRETTFVKAPPSRPLPFAL
ncbi:MAG: tRNA (adenosine(37)-N6)-threonylcarbamoyltransferase complex dimerization subunit type 1 TsaB [Verrucomicrobiota bacterium]